MIITFSMSCIALWFAAKLCGLFVTCFLIVTHQIQAFESVWTKLPGSHVSSTGSCQFDFPNWDEHKLNFTLQVKLQLACCVCSHGFPKFQSDAFMSWALPLLKVPTEPLSSFSFSSVLVAFILSSCGFTCLTLVSPSAPHWRLPFSLADNYCHLHNLTYAWRYWWPAAAPQQELAKKVKAFSQWASAELKDNILFLQILPSKKKKQLWSTSSNCITHVWDYYNTPSLNLLLWFWGQGKEDFLFTCLCF